jgi:hypothetical protein
MYTEFVILPPKLDYHNLQGLIPLPRSAPKHEAYLKAISKAFYT